MGTARKAHEAEQEALSLVELAQDTAKLARLAEDGMTDRELADYFGVDEKQMVGQFDVVLRKARAARQLRVRRTLFAQADKGSPEALNYLVGTYVMADESVEVRPKKRR